MNLLELIQTGLENKDWDQFTKARYIYLKTCEYLTYDYRCHYVDRDFITDLLDKEINLENIIDNRVLCGSWASQIYIKLLEKIGIEGKLVGIPGSHQYVKFNINNQEIIADACISNDLARVKLKNNTLGFYSSHKGHNSIEIEEIDKKIGYLTDQYTGNKLEKIKEELIEEYKQYNEINDIDENKLLLYKLYRIKEIFDELPPIESFSDSEHIITYISNKLLDENEQRKIKKLELYVPDENDWNFMRIYTIDLIDKNYYFSLDNTGYGYSFYETTEEDVLTKKRGNNKKYIG